VSRLAARLPAAGPGDLRHKMATGTLHVRAAACNIVLGTALALAPPASPASGSDRVVVPTPRLLEAMREVHAYELTATANGPRLQADVVVKLVHEATTRDPERRPLFIGHREWFEAFLARTGLAPSQAPLYVRRPYEVGQDLVVDYRRESVVEAVLQGPEPRVAANVRIFWAKGAGQPDQYSYDDTLSRPNLRVTQKRLITYRLLEYEDRLWYAEVSGLHGRPTSGPLGVVFRLIGEARVVESRSAFLPDGTQVVRGRASKWGIDHTETVTVWPDGHADRGIPPGRPDLRAAEKRLLEPLAIRFRPLPPATD
jgi:hypothetical protein